MTLTLLHSSKLLQTTHVQTQYFCILLNVYKCGADTMRSRAAACVLQQKDWLPMTYSCLAVAGNPFAAVIVKKGNVNSTFETTSASDQDLCSRHTLMRYKYPLYPDVDLALLQLHTPNTSMEMLNYTSNNMILLQKTNIWMESILHTDRLVQEHWLQEQSNHLQNVFYSSKDVFAQRSSPLSLICYILYIYYILYRITQ